ncbi:hypothetical protein E2C05_32300, partial [Paracraurococcus ruber]|uniref:hypothetical protein n=1 Tax=Paracraurococcus ruber TaxID=77675 RepID=UPI001057D82F
MRSLPFRPDTGLPALDRARYSHLMAFEGGMPFDGRFGAAIQDGMHLPPGRYEVDVPPAAHHVLFHVFETTGPPGEARIAGRRMAPPRLGAAAVIPAGSDSQWLSRGGGLILHLHVAPAFLAGLAEEDGPAGAAATLPLRTDVADRPLTRLLDRLRRAVGGPGRLDGLVRDQVAVLCAVRMLRLGAPAGPAPQPR